MEIGSRKEITTQSLHLQFCNIFYQVNTLHLFSSFSTLILALYKAIHPEWLLSEIGMLGKYIF